jgi:hypothetical protein
VTTEYPAVPAGAAESGDYYVFLSSANMVTSSGVGEVVYVDTDTTANGPLTVTFPAPWNYAGPTPAVQPVFDMANSGITGTAGLTELGELSWIVGGTSEFNSSVSATGNYLNGSTSLTYPDFTGLTGFVAGPPSGNLAIWSAEVSLATVGSLEPLGANGSVKAVGNSGTFTVP